MVKHNEFVAHVLELMHPLGPVSAKAMFGGYGIFIDDLMFALVADDILYFRVGSDNLTDYEQRGLPPFSYQRNDKTFSMPYREAPPEALDDPDAMHQWASKAVGAALKNRKTRTKA